MNNSIGSHRHPSFGMEEMEKTKAKPESVEIIKSLMLFFVLALGSDFFLFLGLFETFRQIELVACLLISGAYLGFSIAVLFLMMNNKEWILWRKYG